MIGCKRIGKIILFFLICFMAWQMQVCGADAAGANISIEADTTTITKGDIFYVIITVDSTEEMSGFEGYFSYNQSVMKYITGGTVSSGNDDEFSISDMNREESSTELKYSIQFKARRAGSSTIALKSPYGVYCAEDSGKMSVASNVLNVLVVKEPRPTATVEPSNVPEGQEEMEPPPGQPEDEPDSSLEPGDVPEGDVLPEKEIPSEEERDLEGEVSTKVETPSEELMSESEVSTTVIVFLLIFSSCLLIAIIIGLIFMRKQSIEEEEQWSSSEIWDENEQEEETEEKIEDSTETMESLEDIEKRLEKKRYWLRK